ncbi:methyltransferase domain-containing protein [bacterium]|nr:methyltransferase domain-containing protein [bacterium]
MNINRVHLLVLSMIALFAELALIRWLGSEVRIFAYFKNEVLIACLLGFGLGFYYENKQGKVWLSLLAIWFILISIMIPIHADIEWGPQISSKALSNFYGTFVMGDNPAKSSLTIVQFLLGIFWISVLFLACLVVMFGYAQQVGWYISKMGPLRRIEAYSWNVGGSLMGILVFALISSLSWPPLVWFAVILCASLPYLINWQLRLSVLVSLPVMILLLPLNEDVIWSPYQKLEFLHNESCGLVMVNGTGYMILRSFKEQGPADRWNMPYFFKPDAHSVLIVGAGAGNDAAVAIQQQFLKRIVAVDIDEQIIKIGRKSHPDSPYSDPRIEVFIDDARHYIETTNERFDLIIMSHLDAHSALSSYTNVRLDNYIYTVESLAMCKKILEEEGLLYLSYWATQKWVARRLEANLTEAFGHSPATYYYIDRQGIIMCFYAIARSSALTPREFPFITKWQPDLKQTVISSNDDWPYLYIEKKQIPTPILIMAIPLAIIISIVLWLILQTGSNTMKTRYLDRHFFFLGAGFSLIEVHNVSRLARVFGTTWVVNAWVISGVLLIILLANFFVQKGIMNSKKSILFSYLFLLISLIISKMLPIEWIIPLPQGAILLTLIYTIPICFASSIFAFSFKRAERQTQALGSNILGAVLGGFLELFSYAFGISSLMFIAAIVYVLSIPTVQRDEVVRASQ